MLRREPVGFHSQRLPRVVTYVWVFFLLVCGNRLRGTRRFVCMYTFMMQPAIESLNLWSSSCEQSQPSTFLHLAWANDKTEGKMCCVTKNDFWGVRSIAWLQRMLRELRLWWYREGLSGTARNWCDWSSLLIIWPAPTRRKVCCGWSVLASSRKLSYFERPALQGASTVSLQPFLQHSILRRRMQPGSIGLLQSSILRRRSDKSVSISSGRRQWHSTDVPPVNYTTIFSNAMTLIVMTKSIWPTVCGYTKMEALMTSEKILIDPVISESLGSVISGLLCSWFEYKDNISSLSVSACSTKLKERLDALSRESLNASWRSKNDHHHEVGEGTGGQNYKTNTTSSKKIPQQLETSAITEAK